MNRAQWTLTGLFVFQLLLLGVLFPWANPTGAAGSRLLLPELESFTPERIQINEGEDRSVVLDHRGDQWTLEQTDGFPTDEAKLGELLATLKELKVHRPVVSSSRYHTALKVTEDDHERWLRIWKDPSGDPEVELFLGTSPNYRISHVRLGDDDRVYEVQGLSAHDLRAEAVSWIDKEFVRAPFDRVVGFELRNGHGKFTLEKKDGGWTLVTPSGSSGKKLNQSAVDSFVRSLASLQAAEPGGRADTPAYGLDEPEAVAEITLLSEDPEAGADEGAEIIRLQVGNEVEDGDGKRYASRSGFDFSVVLSKWEAEKMTDKKLEDLFEKE